MIGLGPGAAELMVPAVKAELARAEDILGYETYVRMAGPFRDDQVQHCTDNREEMQRARHAFELATQGRSVVVVSSGDPGVFAMAAAVLEALLARQKTGEGRAISVSLFSAMAEWMTHGGEAIFGSRPWRRYGEGPTQLVAGMQNEEKAKPFTAQYIRFTTNKGALYAMFLGRAGGPTTIRSLARRPAAGQI